jgi:hypothetical protein
MEPMWNLKIETGEGDFVEMEFIGPEEEANALAHQLEFIFAQSNNMNTKVEVSKSPNSMV